MSSFLDSILLTSAGLGHGYMDATERRKKYNLDLQAQADERQKALMANELGKQQANTNQYEAETGRQNAGTAHDQYILDLLNSQGGGGNVNIGGFDVPNSLHGYQAASGYLQDAAARQALLEHPDMYGGGAGRGVKGEKGSGPGSEQDVSEKNNALRIKLITDIYGSPQLGIKPEQMDENFKRAFGKAQELMPDVFGKKVDPTKTLIDEIPNYKTQEDFNDELNALLRKQPDLGDQIDMKALQRHLQLLPHRSVTKGKGVKAYKVPNAYGYQGGASTKTGNKK